MTERYLWCSPWSWRHILVLVSALLLPGCPGFGNKTLAELSDVDEEITYEVHIRPILEAKCNSCHSDPPVAGAPNSFVTYDSARAAGDRIRVRSVIEKTMPLGDPLPDNELALIDTWVQSGMPKGSPSHDDPTINDDDSADEEVDVEAIEDDDIEISGDEMSDETSAMGGNAQQDDDAETEDEGQEDVSGDAPLTWDDDIVPIIRASCNGCHVGFISGGLDLGSYEGFLAGGNKANEYATTPVDENPFLGVLRGAFETADGMRIQAMPLGQALLPIDQISIVETWLRDGAPEN